MKSKTSLISQIVILLLISSSVIAEQSSLGQFKQLTKDTMDFMQGQQDKPIGTAIKVNYNKIYTKKSAGKSVIAFKPQKYDFSNKTPNGEFKVLVFENDNSSFEVSFSSEYPIQGYQIVDTNTKAVSVKESLNDKKVYNFSVSKPFEAKYVLILSQYKDGFITQNIIPLYQKANVKFK